MAQSIENQSDADAPCKRAIVSRTITSGRSNVTPNSRPTLSPVLEDQEETHDIKRCDREVTLALSGRPNVWKLTDTDLSSQDVPDQVKGLPSVVVAEASQRPIASPRSISSRIHTVRCKTARGTRSPVRSPLGSPSASLRSPVQLTLRHPPPHSPIRSVRRVTRKPAHVLLRSPTKTGGNMRTVEPLKFNLPPRSPSSPKTKCRRSTSAWKGRAQKTKLLEQATPRLRRDVTTVYQYDDIVEQLRLDRLRRLQDLYRNEIHEVGDRQSDPGTAASKSDILGSVALKGAHRLDIRSPNMCAESPRLATFRTWTQLRQQQLQKLQQIHRHQQQQRHQDRDMVAGGSMTKSTTKTIRVSSKGVTTQEAVTPSRQLSMHDVIDMESTENSLQGAGHSERQYIRRQERMPTKAAQGRIPSVLRRELRATSRRIEQSEASVALEWQEKFDDLSQAVCQFSRC
ncbi:hypothetical protein BGZ73_003244 [Actinomortierella ambigua]|nr:hypothetical protein BGZ73_003244 [Actinomortierella ambigua]